MPGGSASRSRKLESRTDGRQSAVASRVHLGFEDPAAASRYSSHEYKRATPNLRTGILFKPGLEAAALVQRPIRTNCEHAVESWRRNLSQTQQRHHQVRPSVLHSEFTMIHLELRLRSHKHPPRQRKDCNCRSDRPAQRGSPRHLYPRKRAFVPTKCLLSALPAIAFFRSKTCRDSVGRSRLGNLTSAACSMCYLGCASRIQRQRLNKLVKNARGCQRRLPMPRFDFLAQPIWPEAEAGQAQMVALTPHCHDSLHLPSFAHMFRAIIRF